MKKLLTILSISGFLFTAAQQTITGTSPIGFSATIAIASAATASNVPLTTGAGVTWNCSGLITSMPNATLSYNSPVGKPYAMDYSSANYHLDVNIQGTVVANEFYIKGTDSLVKLGGHVAGSPYEIYNNAQLEMKFPFNFNDVFSDNYSKTSYNANGSVSSTQTGSVTLSYEGYGTLILPSGTYSNVALLKRIRTNSIGPTTTSYSWVRYPSGDKLMDYDNNGGIKVNYVASISTGIKDHSKTMDVNVYPTLTNGKVFIEGKTEIGTVKVYSLTGQLIQIFNEQAEIEIKGEKGVYFLEISDKANARKSVRKIVLN